jgi:hypothetical protein
MCNITFVGNAGAGETCLFRLVTQAKSNVCNNKILSYNYRIKETWLNSNFFSYMSILLLVKAIQLR